MLGFRMGLLILVSSTHSHLAETTMASFANSFPYTKLLNLLLVKKARAYSKQRNLWVKLEMKNKDQSTWKSKWTFEHSHWTKDWRCKDESEARTPALQDLTISQRIRTCKQGTAVSNVRGKSRGADSFLMLAFQSHVSDMKCSFLWSMMIKSEGIVCSREISGCYECKCKCIHFKFPGTCTYFYFRMISCVVLSQTPWGKYCTLSGSHVCVTRKFRKMCARKRAKGKT